MRNHDHNNRSYLGQYLTSKLLLIPRPVRYVVVWTGLVLLIYFVNKGIWGY
ncbi:hypothetical protein [Lentibacillus sp.]|uniref:hypothetical protein n=1 Tax=Lentibacillus sp. TaxID=1925746 RepID=UPI002B4ABDC8|nr:hypothetical protein [Lentibacillus sp.]HLS09090.1 hypothetical protein [Lentibacillus sp.]